MLKKIWMFSWNFLGDIRLSFYLLISAALFLLIGAFYSGMNYSYFSKLNEMRLQDWMIQRLAAEPGITWWLPLLLIVLVLLGVNTFICSWDRMSSLLPGRKEVSCRRFLNNITPSLIHYLFIIVMLGHAVTFMLGSWQRIPVKEGASIKISEDFPEFRIDSIENDYFPQDSPLKDRIRQTTVSMRSPKGESLELSFLNHLAFKGYHLHLDMVKKRKDKRSRQEIIEQQKKETCNKEDVYHLKSNQKKKSRKLLLLVIDDPGLYIIISGFVMILILMFWYFVEIRKRNNV